MIFLCISALKLLLTNCRIAEVILKEYKWFFFPTPFRTQSDLLTLFIYFFHSSKVIVRVRYMDRWNVSVVRSYRSEIGVRSFMELVITLRFQNQGIKN